MKQTIPYNEKIVFKTKISEVSSISLEHEFNVANQEINGDFIISGDYKVHDVSVNKDPFLYRLPFSVTMPDNFDIETLEFEIRDFTYDVVAGDTLSVNIEFSVEGEVKEPVVEEIPRKEEIKEPEIIFEEVEDKPVLEDLIEEKEERVDNETQETIIDSLKVEDDNFVTYHIHIVRENDTIETICAKYNAQTESVKNINDLEEINLGDKIIIPQTQNE